MNEYVSRQKEKALEFIEPLKADVKIKGIAFLGSVARNKGDEYSDIDIVVFSDGLLDHIHKGEKWIDHFDYEIFNVDINKGYDDWDEAQKEAYSEGILVYDADGTVSEFLQKALFYSDKQRLDNIVYLLFKLGWHGWSYTPVKESSWKGYVWSLPNDLWLKREDIPNAYYLLSHSMDLFLELLYAINYRWTPDFKWKFKKSFALPWLPSEYGDITSKLMITEAMNEEDYYKKSELFQKLIDECYEKVMKDLPGDMYRYLIDELHEY